MSVSWKKYAPLARKKKRREERKFLVEGVRLCREALASEWEVEAALLTETFSQSPAGAEFRETLQYRKIPWRVVAETPFKRLADTETPQGILMVLPMPEFELQRFNLRKAVFIVLLQGIRDPGNLGTLLRTANWYGADAVILSPDCVEVFNPKVLRSTMGSIFHLPVFSAKNLAEEIGKLKEQRFRIVASDLQGSQVLQETRFKKPVALLLGSEARGLPADLRQLADLRVKLWKYGAAESLNVATAGGIFMHHIAQQIFQTGSKKG